MSDLFQGPYSSPSDALNIQARPPEHEALIRRQGQYARILSSKKCPCIKNGKADLFCTMCRGIGYTLEYQKEAIVYDENSDHNDIFKIYPKGTPLIRVFAIQKVIHESQGGNLDYSNFSFTDAEITVTASKSFKRYEKLRVSYEFNLQTNVTDEDCTHDGTSYKINTIATKTDMRQSNNPFGIHGDIVSISRVYNVTQDITYTVKNFYKQTIVIDEAGPTAAPAADDILECDYKYVTPPQIGTGRLTQDNALQMWGEDFKEGDVQAIIPGYYYIGKGDIITFLFPRIKSTEIITRGGTQKDELPQFDVVEVVGDINDADGTTYDSTKFGLEDYNDLVWESGEGPTVGKKYQVTFLYRPSYQIYKQNFDMMTNENRRFPNLVMMRFMNRFSKKELIQF